MTRRERIVRHTTSSEHIVQFFDSRETLADSVAAFLAEGGRQGEHLLVVAKPKNWLAIAARLRTGDHALSDGVKALITVLDGDAALSQFMRRGLPDSLLFHRTVGELVAKLTSQSSAGFRIYGEMVEILAEEGNFHAARRLEELWNELAVRHSFVLLCGYSSAHFATTAGRSALMNICRTHSHVQKNAADPMAEWLLDAESVAHPRRDDEQLPS